MALKQGKSIPLQEDIDPDYEPSAEGLLSWRLLQVANQFAVATKHTHTALMQKLLTMRNGLALIWKQRKSLYGSVARV